MALKQKISPFLWFDHQAEQAANFYVSIFPNSKILETSRYPEGGIGPKGSVMTVAFELCGQGFIALNGGPYFTFNEAISFSIDCANQDEVDKYWSALTADGGKPGQCGWLKDRFGVSWQVNPAVLGRLLTDSDPQKAARVTQAMMGMTKIDIAKLIAVHAGA